jgi:hypothetical protein
MKIVRVALPLLLALTCLPPASAHPFKRDIAQTGNEAYQLKDFPKAAQEYLKAQDLEPLSAELHLNLGAAYYQQEEFEKAVDEFGQATRADDPLSAASAYYNRGNAKYKSSKREFEAATAAATASATQTSKNPAQDYVKKLEECIQDYEEALKRHPDDRDSKYNIEMIRREIKNLMRRQPQQNRQQSQDQKQDQKDQNQDQQQQQNQEQKQSDQQNKEQQQQDQNKEKSDQGSPTPQSVAEGATPTPADGSENKEVQETTGQPTPMRSMSEEMAKNLLDNLPETRPRNRAKQRYRADKDW